MLPILFSLNFSLIFALIFSPPTFARSTLAPAGGFTKLQPPGLIKPRALTNNGYLIQINPAMPNYLKAYNCGIPGMQGYSGGQCFNALNYKKPGEDEAMADAGDGGGGGGPGGGGMPGGSPGGGDQGYPNVPQSMTPGSPYQGGNDGGWYNSGPDSLCTGTSSFQTKKPNALLPETPDQSLCDVIYNALTTTPCGSGPSTASYVDQLATRPIQGMDEFCPEWNTLKSDPKNRALMLMNLVAAIVTTESGWKNSSTGDGGRSKGMLQLTTATDRKHGCHCERLSDEFNARQNLECGTHMIVSFMARDGVVGQGTGDRGARGIARSFGPFRDGRKERGDIKRKVAAWCKSSATAGTAPGATPATPDAAK